MPMQQFLCPWLFYSFFLPVVCTAQAQSDSIGSRKSIEIELSGVHYRYIDEGFTFRRLPFRGTSPLVRIGFARRNLASAFLAWVEASDGTMKTPDQAVTARLVYLQLAIAYQKRLIAYHLAGWPGQLLLQMQLASTGWVNESLSQMDNVDFLFTHGLHLSLIQHIQMSRTHQLRVEATLPTMAFVKRKVYNGGIEKSIEDDYRYPFKFLYHQSQFTFLSPIHQLQFKLRSFHQLSPKVAFQVSYRFGYVSNFQSDPIWLYSNALLAGFEFTF